MSETQTQDAAQSPLLPDIGGILEAFWARAWEGVTGGITNIPKASFGIQGGWAGLIMVGVGMLFVMAALAMFMIEETGKHKGVQLAKLAAGGI
jgi:hypothetical protein